MPSRQHQAEGPVDADGEMSAVELARACGLTERAVRFYAARGLVSARESGAGRRYFDGAARRRLALVVKYKALGFTLAEIRILLESAPDGGEGLVLSRAQCVAQINWLERRKREIEAALAELRRTYSSHYVASSDARADLVRGG